MLGSYWSGPVAGQFELPLTNGKCCKYWITMSVSEHMSLVRVYVCVCAPPNWIIFGMNLVSDYKLSVMNFLIKTKKTLQK